MGENQNSSSSSYRSSQFMRLPRILNQCHPIRDLFTGEPALPKTRKPSYSGPAAETIHGYLLGLSSTRGRLRPVSHAATV